MKLASLFTPPSKPQRRKLFHCGGCGGLTDGRHLDRELLPKGLCDIDKVPHRPDVLCENWRPLA